MASNSPLDISTKLSLKLNSIDATRRRMDKLFVEGRIFKKDIDLFYESIFLKVITSFEYSLETLFIGALYNKYGLSGRNTPRVIFNSKKVAVDVILNGKKYVEWMPTSKLEDRAKIYFENGMPFACLSNTDKSNLDQAYTIRNAIAHQSTFSQAKFKTKIVDITAGLPDSNKTPAGYLRYIYRSSPDQTKLENFLIEINNIMNKIVTHR
jgi:hypothetical protein